MLRCYLSNALEVVDQAPVAAQKVLHVDGPKNPEIYAAAMKIATDVQQPSILVCSYN